ncbi:MAG: acylneuraminate cytidylyltransferase family protein [Pseudomonadota bacterium]
MGYSAFIFARGGSKGLPGKNLRPLAGKPLIAWSIEQALAVTRIERVIVSTDSPEIASVALDYGAQVPFLRPAELARDDSAEWLAWRHALGYLQAHELKMPTALLSLPATAPLRASCDIEKCLDEYETGAFDIVVTITEASRSPYFNMVKFNTDQSVSLVIPPANGITRRQDAPPVFDMTTVAYVANSAFVMAQTGTFAGRVGAVRVPRERALDIDTLLDFRFAEFLLQNGGK